MICPYCSNKFLSRHVPFCKKRDLSKSTDELRAYYFEYNYPKLFSYDNLVEIYINNEKSLPDIKSEFNIDYKNIQFMLNFYKIPIRGHSEGAQSSMKKREQTNIVKYGAKNVLSKDTVAYRKKIKTIKEKYGVENVFQIKEIIERINNDKIYLEKYGMTKIELIRKNSLNYYHSLDNNEKKLWHERMGRSFYSKVSKANKNKVAQSKLENTVESCFIEMKIEFDRQFIISNEDNNYYFYDFYIKSLNLIIEINGDYWHANPLIYDESYVIRDGYTAGDKWNKDKKKMDLALKNGYDIICIWENEIKKLKKEELKTYLISKISIYSKM